MYQTCSCTGLWWVWGCQQTLRMKLSAFKAMACIWDICIHTVSYAVIIYSCMEQKWRYASIYLICLNSRLRWRTFSPAVFTETVKQRRRITTLHTITLLESKLRLSKRLPGEGGAKCWWRHYVKIENLCESFVMNVSFSYELVLRMRR